MFLPELSSLWVLVKTAEVEPRQLWRSQAQLSLCRRLMKREHENYDKDECEKKKVQEMKRERGCVMLPGLFNQSRVSSTAGRATEMWRFNNNSTLCSSEDWKTERVTHRADSSIHHLHRPPDARSSVTVGPIRATEVWAQMWRAETGAWSIATYVEKRSLKQETFKGLPSLQDGFKCPHVNKLKHW